MDDRSTHEAIGSQPARGPAPEPATLRPTEASFRIPAGVLSDVFEAGGPAMVLELIDLYLASLDRAATELVPAVRDGRTVAAAEAAHRLRGGAAAMGELELAELMARVESVPARPDGPGVAAEEVSAMIAGSRGRVEDLARQLRGGPRTP